MLKHDLKQGIVKYIWIYIILGVVVFWGCAFFLRDMKQTLKYENSEYAISAVSMVLYMLQGEEGGWMMPSIRWMLPLILSGYIIYTYPVHDLSRYGYNYMIRTKSKVRWWLAKCGWLFFHVLACIAVLLFAAALCAWSKGEPVFAMPPRAVLESLNLLGLYHMDRLHIVAVFALMFMTLLAMSILQMLFSFVFSPIAAYLGMIVVFVASWCQMTWLLPGNYLMLQRMRDVSSSRWEGFNQWMGIPYMVILLVAVLFGGAAFMKRHDIL